LVWERDDCRISRLILDIIQKFVFSAHSEPKVVELSGKFPWPSFSKVEISENYRLYITLNLDSIEICVLNPVELIL
jgi:hypothetical protein